MGRCSVVASLATDPGAWYDVDSHAEASARSVVGRACGPSPHEPARRGDAGERAASRSQTLQYDSLEIGRREGIEHIVAAIIVFRQLFLVFVEVGLKHG